MKNKIYLVATPIGNYDDITLRGLNLLKDADLVVCEEYKEARRLLAHYGIQKELVSLNEHNEAETVSEVIDEIKSGKLVVLISDCGTPLFSDPGHILVGQCISAGIQVVPVPGANSLMPALTGSGLDFEKFYHYGWLSPKKEIRRRELNRLKNMQEVIVILDTPYRLKALTKDVLKIFGPNLHVVLAFELTKKGERFYRGKISEIAEMVEKQSMKGEFVFIMNNKR